VNVPLALITALLGLLWVPRDVPRAGGLPELVREIDIPGVVLFAAALLSLMAFLMNLDRPLWWMLPVSGATWTLFWRHSSRRRQPFIDVRILAANIPLSLTLVRVTLPLLSPYSWFYGFAQ